MTKIFLMVVGLTFLICQTEAGRVDNKLKIRLEKGEVLDVMIQFPSNSDVFNSPSLLGITNREARIATMTTTLKLRAQTNMKPFVNILTQLGLSNQPSITNPLWISNVFEVKVCDLALAQVLSRVPGDFVIREQVEGAIIEHTDSRPADLEEVRQNLAQWGVSMIQAPLVWNRTRGEGIVVGIIDTGVYAEHEALVNAYACRNQSNVTNCRGWYDPLYNEMTPNDNNGHGTHCIGSTLGRTNGIGVAPAAEWIACRGFDNSGFASESGLLGCGQFMLEEANPMPDIVTNSWRVRFGDDFFNDVLQAWIAAGIIPVFAVGNEGPSCRSTTPPANQPYSISVGATNSLDQLAIFSSRGPYGHSLKPDVSAPGYGIISATNSGVRDYFTHSGTSMATPHVAGVIALILSENPSLDYYNVKALLESTGDRPTVSAADRSCYPSGQDWPNNAFGHGRINAARALGV